MAAPMATSSSTACSTSWHRSFARRRWARRQAMNEFELIGRYFRRAPRNPDVRIGIGDDGAVIAPSPGMEYVVSVDMLVEGRHFAAGAEAQALGHKTLAVN